MALRKWLKRLFVLKNLCNVDEYRRAFTCEQKLEVLTKMRHIFGICLSMTSHQIADLKEEIIRENFISFYGTNMVTIN